MNNLKEQLKTLGELIPEPNEQRVEFLRTRLMSRIKFEQFNTNPENFYKLTFKEFLREMLHPWQLVRSFGTVTAVLILTITVGFGTAVAANFSGPGDALYGVKITLERMPLVLPIVPEEQKVSTELKIAKKRKEEIENIIKSNEKKEEKSKKIQGVAKSLSKTIESASIRMQKIKEESAKEEVVSIASSIKKDVADIKDGLVKAAVSVKNENIDDHTSEELKKVSDLVSGAELSILGVLIDAVDNKSLSADNNNEQAEGVGKNVQEQENVQDIVSDTVNTADGSKTAPKKDTKLSKTSPAGSLDNTDKEGSPELEKLNIKGGEKDALVRIENRPVSGDSGDQTLDKVSDTGENLINKINLEDGNSLGKQVAVEDNGLNNNTNIKDEIAEDLYKAIEDLESKISVKKDVLDSGDVKKDEEPNSGIEADSVETKGAETKETKDVVLNVEEIIDKEFEQTKASKIRESVENYVNYAKKKIEAGDLKGAWEDIQSAYNLFKEAGL